MNDFYQDPLYQGNVDSMEELNRILDARYGDDESVRLLVWISDTHLCTPGTSADKTREGRHRQVERVFTELNQLAIKPEAVVFGGDILDTGSSVEFDTFSGFLDLLKCPTAYLLGNHEHTCAPITEQFKADYNRIRRPGWGDMEDPDGLYYRLDLDGFTLLCLDAQEGSFEYHLPKRQYAWLEAQLESLDQPALICCHRHFLPAGCWIDEYTVRDLDLWKLINGNPWVMGVLSGHSHHPRRFTFHEKDYTVFPAVAYGVGGPTGWGGVILRSGKIAEVFYKPLVTDYMDENERRPRSQSGYPVFLPSEDFLTDDYYNPCFWEQA